MRVVALYRVSSEKQANEGASLDAQQRRYRELAAAHRWETVAEFRGTESATKAASERQVLQRVLETLRVETVDALWVYEQSRLARGDELEVALLIRELRERNVFVYVLDRAIDLSDPGAGMMFRIQGAFDRHEVDRFQERVARGREEKARQGKRPVGRAPIGYRNPPPGDPNRGKLQVVEEEAAVVRRIFQMAAAGVGRGAIARALTAAGIRPPRSGEGRSWSKQSVTCILRNRAYLGAAVARVWVKKDGEPRRMDLTNPRAIVVENAHEAIIDAETWERAHVRDGSRTGGSPALLTGLLYVDGKRVCIDQVRRGECFYRPRNQESGIGVRADEANRLVWAGVVAMLRRPERVIALLERAADPEAIAKAKEEAAAAERSVARLRERIRRLTDMRADGELERAEFVARRDEAARQLREVEEHATTLDRRLATAGDGRGRRELLAVSALVCAGKMATPRRREVLAALVERIDATVIDRGPNRKNERGRFLPRAEGRWGLQDVLVRLRGVDPDGSARGSCRSPITVQIVRAGRVVEPPAPERQRKRGAA